MKLDVLLARAHELNAGTTLEIPYYEWPVAEIDIMLRREGRKQEPTVHDLMMFQVHVQLGIVRVIRGPEPRPSDLDRFKRWIKEQHRTWYEHEAERDSFAIV